MIAVQFEILRDVFWSPSRAVAKAAGERSLWVVRVLVLAMVGISTALANDFMMRVFMSGARGGHEAGSLETFIPFAGYAAVGTALAAQAVSWHVRAALLFILQTLISSADVPYRKFLSVAVLSSIVANLAPFHLLAVWYARGVESFASIHELFVPTGLNLLPIQMSPLVGNLLGHFNPYELGCAAFLAFGFSYLTRIPAKSGYVIIGGLWLVWALVRASLFPTP